MLSRRSVTSTADGAAFCGLRMMFLLGRFVNVDRDHLYALDAVLLLAKKLIDDHRDTQVAA